MTLPPLPKPHLLIFDAALQSPIDGWTRSQVEAYARVAVEAEREDAERYRWLRAHMGWYSTADSPGGPALASVSERIWYHATEDTESVTLDAAIDRARGETGDSND